MFRISNLPLLVLAVLAIAAAPASAPAPAADPFAALTFRSIGPNSGRLDAAAGVPGDPSVYYVAGLGGLFKSTNGGASYSSIFDEPDVSSVGAIAVAPSNANVVYIGTGEPNIRNDIEPGDGVWRSDDAGKTWVHVGLDGTAHIAQIAIDPHDANVAYVAAEGRIYANNAERGIYKTTDGGKTWQHVLAIDDTTGASSVAIDPANPNTVLAGAWTIWRRPWTMNSGGPNDGLYISHDAGAHWTRLEGHGLPGGLMGRIGLAYAPSQPSRIYALIESQEGVLYRSDDGGATWQSINTSHEIWQRPFYFFELTVDPRNPDHVYFPSVNFYETTDGGKTLKRANGLGDNHQLWIDPEDSERMIMASDGGTGVSLNGGKTWIYAQIPISQVYHLDTDDRVPYTICVEIQDAGSTCGPSNSKGTGILPGDWYATFGGESGWTLFDPANPDYIYGSGYTGALTRFDRRTHQGLSIAPWPQDTIGWAAQDERYRFQWTAPIAVSKLEPRALYFGGNVLFKSDDEGPHWHIISPDLTRDDKSKQGPTGGPISHDATSVETYDTIFTIAESPLRRGELWVGTDDGLVWLSRDDGKHWQNLTSHIPGIPEWARVISVTPSWFDPATAYLAVDTHLLGTRAPYLWVTHDYGRHWRSIAGTLTNASYALVLKEDPFRRGMLYLGTGTGLYVSYDDGSTWRQLHNGLPTVPVYDVTVQRRFDDLVVGTHGRGVYVMDDIRALQDDRSEITSKALTLYPMRTAYRFGFGKLTYEQENQVGDDPPAGAIADFWLREAPAKDEKVTVRIYDGAILIRTIDVKKPTAGVNRVVWDLRYEGIKPAPDSDPWSGGGFAGPLAVPGTYRVNVSAGAQSASGLVRVASDPSLHVSDDALREQFAFQMRIHNDLGRINDEIAALRAAKKAHPDQAASIDAALDGLFQPQATQGEDVLRYPVHVYEQLSSLASYADSADSAPTEADRSVLAYLESEMRAGLDRAGAVLRTMPSTAKPRE
jgi:photosystem II stability/assembly factor-like uncharacterized protein